MCFLLPQVHRSAPLVSLLNSSRVAVVWVSSLGLTFRHRASSIQDRHFATLQRTLFVYLINKYISLSDICLTCIIDINNIDNQLDATITAY